MKIYRNREIPDIPFPEILSYRLLVRKPAGLGEINKTEGDKLDGISEGATSTFQIFFQSDAPTEDMVTGDYWVDSDDNKTYRYADAAWGEIQDDDIGTAIANALLAQNTADNKIYVFRQDAAPTDEDAPDPPGVLSVGDMWLDSNDNNKPYRYDGESWISAEFDVAAWAKILDIPSALFQIFYQSDAPGSGMSTGDYWKDSDDNKLYRYTGAAWSEVQDDDIQTAIDNALAAQNTADGKRRIFRAEPTTPYNVGDLWSEGPTGDVKICKTERLSGAFQAADWELASKYTDDTAAEAAQDSADANDLLLDDIADDEKITPVEKLTIKPIWDAVVAEKVDLDSSADAYGISKVAYGNAYDALNTYLNTTLTVFADMAATTDITRATWDTKWDDYFNAKIELINAITAKAKELADAAQSTADNKIYVFMQDTAPVDGDAPDPPGELSEGDIWIDSNDDNKPYRYSAAGEGEWVATEFDVAAWMKITDKPDKLVQIFYQSTAPDSGMSTGDYWRDSDDNMVYRYTGAAWEEVQDDDIAQAITNASDAQATADNKVYIFYQAEAPIDDDAPDPPGELSVGDLWIDSDDDNKPYRYSGAAWVSAEYDVAAWSKIIDDGNRPEDNATEGADWLTNLSNAYLENFIAGEDVVQGKAASVVGYFTQNSTEAQLTDDNYVDENTPDSTPSPTATAIYVEFFATNQKYSLFKFNLSDLPTKEDEPFKEIIQVILHIRCIQNTIPIQLKKITSDWAENTVTWNTKPSLSGDYYWQGTPSVGWNEIDITRLYREDLSGPIFGLCFVGVSGGEVEQTLLRTNESGDKPYLEIIYRKKEIGEIYKANAKDGKCADGYIGFFNESKSAAQTVKVAIGGIETHQSGLTIGKRYYLTDVGGVIGTTPGDFAALVGKAIAETKLLTYGGFVNAEMVKETELYLISDDVYKSDDAEESVGAAGGVFTKLKEFTLPSNFPTKTLRIYFELKDSDNWTWARAKIYKNGDPFGTQKSNNSTTYSSSTEDLLFQPGDTIELWVKIDTGAGGISATVRNFRILGTPVLTAQKYIIPTTY